MMRWVVLVLANLRQQLRRTIRRCQQLSGKRGKTRNRTSLLKRLTTPRSNSSSDLYFRAARFFVLWRIRNFAIFFLAHPGRVGSLSVGFGDWTTPSLGCDFSRPHKRCRSTCYERWGFSGQQTSWEVFFGWLGELKQNSSTSMHHILPLISWHMFFLEKNTPPQLVLRLNNQTSIHFNWVVCEVFDKVWIQALPFRLMIYHLDISEQEKGSTREVTGKRIKELVLVSWFILLICQVLPSSLLAISVQPLAIARGPAGLCILKPFREFWRTSPKKFKPARSWPLKSPSKTEMRWSWGNHNFNQ